MDKIVIGRTHYLVTLKCGNCKHIPKKVVPNPSAGVGGFVSGTDPAEFTVPKGTTVEEFFKDELCLKCRCKGFLGIA